jgi:hypothetical protein
MKVQEFRSDFAFVNLSEDDLKSDHELNITNVRLKCDAQLITPNGVRNGLLSLTKKRSFLTTKLMLFESDCRIFQKLISAATCWLTPGWKSS